MWHCRQSQFPPASQSIRQTLRLDKSFAPPRQNTFQNSSLLYTTKATVVCIFYLNFELQLGKSNKFNNQRIKLLVRSSFKNHFFATKKTVKKRIGPARDFLQPSSCLNTLLQNQAPLFCSPLFQKIYQLPGKDQQNGRRVQCELPPFSFRINFKDTSCHISVDSLGIYLSLGSLFNF